MPFSFLRPKNRKNSNRSTNSNTPSYTFASNETTMPDSSLKSTFGSFLHKSPSTRRPAPGTNNPFQARSSDAPPAYSSAPPPSNPMPATTTTGHSSSGGIREDTDFSYLSTFDTVFLIDDSASMHGPSWHETAEALKRITPVCTEYDSNGIDIYFLNERDNVEYHNITSPAMVESIFRSVSPRGGTPTGTRLHQILRPYLRDLQQRGEDAVKPLNIIVITDGQATDDVHSTIISAAQKLDAMDAPAWQVGIQFFQVGRDEGATAMLQEMDDSLGRRSGVRDMVDTMTWVGSSGTGLNAEGVLKCVLGAVVRRHDNAEGGSSRYRPL